MSGIHFPLHFPEEMLLNIYEFLSERDLMAVRTVCSLWKRISAENSLWKEKIKMKTPLSFAAGPEENILGHYALNRPGAAIRCLKSHLGKAYSAWGKTIAVWKADYSYQHTCLKCTYTETDHTASINAFYYQKKGSTPFITTASSDKTLKIWKQILGSDRFENSGTLEAHQTAITAVTGTSRCLFSGSEDGKIAYWADDYNSLKPSYHLRQLFYGHSRGISVLKTDGIYSFRKLFSGSIDGTVKVWQKNGKVLSWSQTLLGHQGEITAIAYEPCNDILATGSVDRTIRLWKKASRTYECVALLQHPEKITDVLFLSGPFRLAAAAADGSIRIWEKRPQEEQYEIASEISLGAPVRYATLEHVSAFTFDTVSSLYCVTEKSFSIIKLAENPPKRIVFPVKPQPTVPFEWLDGKSEKM